MSDHLLALDALVDINRQRLACERIDDGQRLQPPTIEQRIRDESIDHISFAANAAGYCSRLAAVLTVRQGCLSRRLSSSPRQSR